MVYEVRGDGDVIDYGYALIDRFYRSGRLNDLIRGDGLELKILSPSEGIDEIHAISTWSELKSRLS